MIFYARITVIRIGTPDINILNTYNTKNQSNNINIKRPFYAHIRHTRKHILNTRIHRMWCVYTVHHRNGRFYMCENVK